MAIASGKIITRSVVAITTKRDVPIPEGISIVRIKNNGVEAVLLWFDAGTEADAYLMSPGEILPEVIVDGLKTVARIKTRFNSSEIYIIGWG